MSQHVLDWVNSEEFQELKERPEKDIYNFHFHRDPFRYIIRDRNTIYSPADGVLIYQKEVSSKKDKIELKGSEYTLEEILINPKFLEFDRALVFGIFMTFFDVHENRMPTNGKVERIDLPAIESINYPMISLEDYYFSEMRNPVADYTYLVKNERVINKVYVPEWDYTYYVIQIADEEVDMIVSYYNPNNNYVSQGDRFGCIRYGSQCDVILPLPLPKGFNYELVQKKDYHLEAGIDPLLILK